MHHMFDTCECSHCMLFLVHNMWHHASLPPLPQLSISSRNRNTVSATHGCPVMHACTANACCTVCPFSACLQVGGALLAASYILARISLLGLLYTGVCASGNAW